MSSDHTQDQPAAPVPPKSRRLRVLELPLLQKDLLEQASRSWTYIERMLYVAGVLFLSYLSLPVSWSRIAQSPLDYLGVGKQVFFFIVPLQKLSLFLVLPVMSAGAIVQERERRTLDLLTITSLTPGMIILEKFLARLIPAFNLLLVTAPVIAFFHVLGGIEAEQVIGALVNLLMMALELTAIGIMFSTLRRSVQSALLATYLWYLIFGFVTHYILASLMIVPEFSWSPGRLSGMVNAQFHWDYSAVFTVIILPIVTTTVYLLVARHKLITQSAPQTGEVLESKTLAISARSEYGSRGKFFESQLPDEDPVAWRQRLDRVERSTTAADFRNFSLFVAANTIPFAILISYLSQEAALFLWAFATVPWTVLLCVRQSGKLAKERTSQTLPILLTAPLTGSVIVQQSMSKAKESVTYWQIVSISWLIGTWAGHPSLLVLIHGVVAIWLFPAIVTMQVAVCDLSSSNTYRATVKSLAILAARAFGPYFLITLLRSSITQYVSYDTYHVVQVLCHATSPLGLLTGAQTLLWRKPDPWLATLHLCVSLATNLAIFLWLRKKATIYADFYLGRLTPHVPFWKRITWLTTWRYS